MIAAAGNGADLIYTGGDELAPLNQTRFHWDLHQLKEAINQAHQAGAGLIIGLPGIQKEEQLALGCGLKELQNILTLAADGIMVSNLGTLQIALQESQLPLYLNYTLNLFNDCGIRGIRELLGRRLEQITLSPELTMEQIHGLYSLKIGPRLECLVQGPLELMIAEYCPIGSILSRDESCVRMPSSSCVAEKGPYAFRDRLNLDFPVAMDQFCRMHLFNSKDLCLYEDLRVLIKPYPLVLRLEMKIHPAVEVGYFCKAYKNRLEKIEREQVSNEGGELVVDEFIKHTGRGITKGHYFRGVE